MELFKIFGIIDINDKDAISKIDGIDKKGSDLGNNFGKLGKVVAGAFSVAAVVGFEKAVINTFATYDDQMRIVRAATGATEEDYKALRSEAEKLGKTTRFSASEAGKAMENLGRAGWSAAETLEGVGDSLTFATANAIGLNEATTIMTTGLSQFNMKTSETGRFMDVLSETSRSANTNVEALGESFEQVGPVAGAMNYKIEDISVALGIMANKGIVGGKAGTTLRNAITSLAKPTDTAQKLLDELGISIADSSGKAKPFEDVLVNLRGELGKLDEVQQAQAITTIFGKESMAGIMAIVNTTTEEFDKMTESIKNSNGVTKEMQEIMDGGIGGAIANVKSAWEGVLISIGNMQDGFLVDILNLIAEAIQKIPDAIERMEPTLKLLMQLIKGLVFILEPFLNLLILISPALVSLGVGVGIFKGMQKAVTAYNAIMGIATTATGTFGTTLTVLTGPVGLVVAAILALVAAGVAVYKNWDTIKEKGKQLFSFLSGIFGKIGETIKKPFKAAADFVGKQVERIKNFFKGLKLELPKIKVPKFELKGKFSLKDMKVPSIKTLWNAKGGVMERPTIFGGNGSTLYGGGEAGNEGIVPLEGRHMVPMATAIAEILKKYDEKDIGQVIHNEFNIAQLVVREEADIRKIAEKLEELVRRKNRARGVTA